MQMKCCTGYKTAKSDQRLLRCEILYLLLQLNLSLTLGSTAARLL